VAWAYFAVVTLCLLCFVLYPVSAAGLRPSLAGLDPSRFAVWGLRLNYALDPPVNLFPSLHLAGATIAALGAWKARPAYGALAGVAVAPIAVAVCTVKQHYWIDAVGGVALAVAVYARWLRDYEPPPDERPARGWGAWIVFAAFLATPYAGLWLAWRAGL
jgi:membrane-associated phospholipid phosphatase